MRSGSTASWAEPANTITPMAAAWTLLNPAAVIATPATIPQGMMPTRSGTAARAPSRKAETSSRERFMVEKKGPPSSGPFASRGPLFLQVAVQHLDELVRREETLAPFRVVLRARLGLHDFLELLPLLDLSRDAARDRGEHVAVGLQVGLRGERTVPRDDLGVVPRRLQLAVHRGEHPRHRP